jgi:hypothetical protein
MRTVSAAASLCRNIMFCTVSCSIALSNGERDKLRELEEDARSALTRFTPVITHCAGRPAQHAISPPSCPPSLLLPYSSSCGSEELV